MTRVRCIANGLTVAGIPAARTFVPGDEIDLDATVHAAQTWRHVLGRFAASHFAPVAPVGRRHQAIARTQAADRLDASANQEID